MKREIVKGSIVRFQVQMNQHLVRCTGSVIIVEPHATTETTYVVDYDYNGVNFTGRFPKSKLTLI